MLSVECGCVIITLAFFCSDEDGGRCREARGKSDHGKKNWKKTKKERLEKLLNSAIIEYNKKDTSHQKSAKGFHEYTFKIDKNIKEFPKSWYNLGRKSLEIIYDELQYWDSYEGKNRLYSYSSISKNNAEFVQFLFSTLGKRSIIYEDTHRKNICYQVSQTKRILSHMISSKQVIHETREHDGYKYCFTVPSGMLVLRRNYRINKR